MSISRILIIDDDLFQLKLLEKMLSKLTKAQITVASNGQEALTKLNVIVKPDLILCDLNMPEMDGIEFLRIISTNRLVGSVVLMSSAATDVVSSVKKMASSYGLSNILNLEKPIGSHHLKGILSQIIKNNSVKMTHSKAQYQPKDNEIIDAFEQGQFVPFFQPHIDAESNIVVGAEALIRWLHPTKGILTPNVFLDQMMELNLSTKLALKVLDFSIAACARWFRAGKIYSISVNVSPSDLTDLNFANVVLDLLSGYKLPPSYLTLEITENEICPNQAKALETMSRLRIAGVHLSIDDFGTGYSSLTQLIFSPFTELKVDQLFVRNMLTNSKHFAAVKSSLTLAQHLNLRSVAEGVESEAQANALRELGCDVLQGWTYAPAMAEDVFLNWCNRHRKN
jgi:EAL domain-containing protein (putative c-di-GMP-specific phosphodiesterase class I)/DNA-binding NarL/FixJ family response regulator